MDAFEHVVAELFWAQGYWVRTSVAVEVSKEQRAVVGNPTMPRPEIDVLAYDGGKNHLLALECKSFFDSRGVTYGEVCGASDSKSYKLFRRPALREMVLDHLATQCVARGLCRTGVTVQLGMVAGKVYRQDEADLERLFEQNGWFFRGPSWVRGELSKQAETRYTNQVSTVVAKILLRK
jgi:hypothetical protein